MIIEIIGQAISIVAMAIIILSFQMKRNRNLFIMQIIAQSMFAISYFCLGSYDAVIANAVGIVRCAIFLIKKLKGNIFVLIILESLCIIGILPFYSSVFTILIIFAQLVGTYAFWRDNGKIIRYCNLCCISPIWLANNIYVFTIGGILCECFNIISILVSFFRFKKTGFTK